MSEILIWKKASFFGMEMSTRERECDRQIIARNVNKKS